jgi:hypothetical protein
VANPHFADRRRNLWFCEFDDWRLRNKTAVFNRRPSSGTGMTAKAWQFRSRSTRTLPVLVSPHQNQGSQARQRH